jgi:hypothetical protein
MKNRQILIELVSMAITVVFAMLLLNAIGMPVLPRLFLSVAAGMSVFVLLGYPKVYGILESGLKRLPWILFTTGLLALGVMVGWTEFGFIPIYLLGVSAFALIGAIMIASISKKTSFGRELASRISMALMYVIAFMRLRNEQTRIKDFDNHMRVIQLRVSEIFDYWIG